MCRRSCAAKPRRPERVASIHPRFFNLVPKGAHVNAPLFLVRRACSAAGGRKSRPNLMEVKGSEAQGRHREVGSEGSVEQRHGPMDKNRIGGLRRRTSEPMIAKSVSIKGAGGKSDGRVSKAVELIAGDLLHVSNSRLRVKQFTLILQQKSAAGVVLTEVRKAQTAGSDK
jgi:hypothetical protein